MDHESKARETLRHVHNSRLSDVLKRDGEHVQLCKATSQQFMIDLTALLV